LTLLRLTGGHWRRDGDSPLQRKAGHCPAFSPAELYIALAGFARIVTTVGDLLL
jgi:hypothetical protein